MEQETPKLDNLRALADAYAKELDAQFRTLNLLVQHAGEIGRSHEVYLRSVLRRFLPGRYRCGTGFIVAPNAVTHQQDIIVFDPTNYPPLFEVGDCVVVDADAVAAAIEVKTSLDNAKAFSTAIDRVMDLTRFDRFHGFSGIYAWEGLSERALLDLLWERYRSATRIGSVTIPDAIYVRGAYLILPNDDGSLETPPMWIIRVDGTSRTEGEALLSLVARMWLTGFRCNMPWWINSWRYLMSSVWEPIDWPADLGERVELELRT
jgi:hypothetical protein